MKKRLTWFCSLSLYIGEGTRGVMVSGGARGVTVIIVGNGHGDTSSIPGRD